MLDAAIWLLRHLAGGLVDLFRLLVDPSRWPDPATGEGLAAIVYYGASVEFLFVVIDLALVVLVLGLLRPAFLWRVVRGIEGVSNAVGRVAAWAVLIMVLQQVMIVALQRVFQVSEISFGPFGLALTRDLSWFSEELKLYNAAIVALCAAYTFVQGGHVRVDLVYAAVPFRRKRVLDMFGSLVFLLPFSGVVWLFGWFFLWRHLITPKVSAVDTIELLQRKAPLIRWNVETIGFSPNGFDGYFLFKILLVAFAGMMFLQGLGHFYRSLLEYREGKAAGDRFRDLDRLPGDDSGGTGGAPVPAGSPGGGG